MYQTRVYTLLFVEKFPPRYGRDPWFEGNAIAILALRVNGQTIHRTR
jgi:hypothetical protein